MSTKPVGLGEKRKPAFAALAACVVFAVVVMGPVKLERMRSNAIDVFKNGVYENATLSARGDMIKAAENAGLLANSAGAYLGEDDAGVRELLSLSEAILANQDDPGAMLAAFRTLPTKADALFLRLEAAQPSETILRDATAQKAVIKNKGELVYTDRYFALANEFNDARSGFPANLLAWINGIDELGTGQ